MPRTARASRGNVCYHVINRGNRRAKVFFKAGDYRAFIQVMHDLAEAVPLRVLAYCLMPNHFHLVLWPHRDGELGRWMQRLLTAHVRRYHRHRHGSGHLWQGRFKAFPIEEDEHLLTVLRYVERNPLRAGLVERAEDWPWSSLPAWIGGERPDWLVAGPVCRPKDWLGRVQEPLTASELEQVRLSVTRGRPFGNAAWVEATAQELRLTSTIRPRGRPRKAKAEEGDGLRLF